MNLFATSSLILSICALGLALFILRYGRLKIHKLWALFQLSIFVWTIGLFLISLSSQENESIFWWRFAHIGGLFISIFFYHTVCTLCDLNRSKTIKFAYIQALIFLILNFTPLFISSVTIKFNSILYINANVYYTIALLLWLAFVVLGHFELIFSFKNSLPINRQKIGYLLFGFFIGFLGGITYFLPMYNVDIFPIGNFTIPLYCLLSTYVILRYQIVDFKIAITRFGTFIIVYIVILGIPFWVGLKYLGKGTWLIPTGICALLATVCPFVFLYIQQRAEENLLQKEQRIQDLLIQASYGMNSIHDLKKLLNLIINVVVKTLQVNKAEVYLLNREGDRYFLKAPLIKDQDEFSISANDSLIDLLKKKKFPLVYEEIKILSENKELNISNVELEMKNLAASIVVPITVNSSLLGFLVLGDRKSKAMHSKELLNTLSVLGNQTALAIENCNYIAAETKRLEAEGLKERMVSLDHMASSMAHEIDNPMHIIRSSLSFVKDFLLKDARVASLPEAIKEDFKDAIVRSLQAGDRVSGMIRAILDYSRMGTGQLESIHINDAVEGFMQLMQPQIKEERVQFKKEIEPDLPMILGDKVQMEEVLMNFVRNSLHAIRGIEEKKINLKIFKKNEHTIRIECSDNGYGIPKEIINDIFLSSTTTKGSIEGTGLGLYRVRKIIDLFRGKVWAESGGKEKGSTFIVELPVYEGNHANGNDKN